MALAFGSKTNYKPMFQPDSPCPSCPPTECADSPGRCTSSAELTAQCTDQCVVIACSDPNHPESMCSGSGTDTHCDLVCDEATECTDCHGFDAFLQCCEDSHPYNVQPPRPAFQTIPSPNISWGPSFEELWCACNQQQTADATKTYGSPERTMDIYADTQVPLARGSNTFLDKTPHPSHHNSFHMSTFSEPAQSAAKAPPLPSCLWDSCQGTFPSLSDLVGHVNLHLVNSLPSSSHYSDNHVHPQPTSPTSMSCLWGDCNSSYPSWPNDFELLAHHLMNDHLGIAPPYPYLPYQYQPIASSSRVTPPAISFPTVVPSSDVDEPGIDSHSTQSRSPTPAVKTDHSCMDVHKCRWRDCGQSFHSCDELTSHINAEHIGGGKAHYECFWDQCPRNGIQGFQSKQKISRHVQSHTGHRPFQCNICQQNFSEAATLQQHIRRHTQEKPYVCDYPGCGKSFAITGALTIHKRTHNGDKPFKCTYCERGFAESSNLSKHVKSRFAGSNAPTKALITVVHLASDPYRSATIYMRRTRL